MTKTRPGGSIFTRCQGVNFQAVLTELRAQLEHDTARFTIKAAVPYAGIPSAVNSLIIPDVYVLNRSDASLELTFTLLAADGSGPFESATTSARTVSAGDRSLAQPHAS